MEEFNFESSADILVPSDPFSQIIGQDEAVKLAKICALQRRHLLLIGPPGTGKSLIAKAIASYLSLPNEEIAVLHNPEKPERPFLEIRTRKEILLGFSQQKNQTSKRLLVKPQNVPSFVSQKLGYKCPFCQEFSDPDLSICPFCKKEKFQQVFRGPFEDILSSSVSNKREDKVFSSKIVNDKEKVIVFKRFNKDLIAVSELSNAFDKRSSLERNVLVPLDRKQFVQATGASKTELLGDVRHDPYGGHHQIGVPPYQRVIPGAIHEAHEGVLFIDELVSLGRLQRHLLTAMQEKVFPITGRNSSSTGSSVRVDKVPCNFILVSAINLSDLPKIMPQLRSRINGDGYEVILNSYMDDNSKNRKLFLQFISQEVKKDGKIPHVSSKAAYELYLYAKARAKKIDKKNGISLRLRHIAGILKAAGDIANYTNSDLIQPEHVREAIEKRKVAEEQISSKYGSLFKASLADWDYDTSPSASKEVG